METKNKFALKMADGAQVRNIDDLKAHFDIESVAKYFYEGKLFTWLRDRYYDEEADAIKNLVRTDKDLRQKLSVIFGMETEEKPAWLIERLNRLKQYTEDEKILACVDRVAFDQEDLADLLDEGTREIYLCANRFVIPLRMKNKTYIGISEAVVVIRSKEPVDFATLGIEFKNISFDDDYKKILPPPPPPPTKSKPKIKNSDVTIKNIGGNRFEATTTIKNIAGIYILPASLLVKKACSFKSKIYFKSRSKIVDAKNLLNIVLMGLLKGMEVTIIAEGSDAKEAVIALKELIDSKFGEN